MKKESYKHTILLILTIPLIRNFNTIAIVHIQDLESQALLYVRVKRLVW